VGSIAQDGLPYHLESMIVSLTENLTVTRREVVMAKYDLINAAELIYWYVF
jgi:hypothetical protein